MDDPNLELRSKMSRLVSWSDHAYKKLANLPDSTLTYNRWMKLVAEYYIDSMNGDGSDAARLSSSNTLLLRATKKTGCSQDITREIFKQAAVLPCRSITIKRDRETERRYPHLTLECIEALTLRYYIPLKSGGHFLSMDTTLYQDLFKSSKLPVLECYASPYNHNLKQYCSLFPEDKIFGACPRFDSFIDNINFPCRLLANPPYTVSSIKTCSEKILQYMSRQNGEFIALLPLMYDFKSMDNLLRSENTASILLQGGTYLLHDFLTGTDIVAPMNLYIVVNIEGSYSASGKMVANIAFRLRERTIDVIRSQQDVR